MKTIGLIFTTIDRPEGALRLLDSVARFHPEIQVYVVEQAGAAGAIAAACQAHGYWHRLAPYDAGVSHGRNLAIAAVKEEFFFLVDDDFVLLEPIRYQPALELLRDTPAALMVGGDLDELSEKEAKRPPILLHRGRNMLLDRIGRGLLLCSAVFLDTSTVEFAGETMFRCEMVAQWALCRTAPFHARGLRWDERFKNNGEHVDFFLMLKTAHPDLAIFYWPGLRCAHDPRREEGYRDLRMREDWQEIFAVKWDLAYMGNLGGSIRRFREQLRIGHDPTPLRRGQTVEIERLRALLAETRARLRAQQARIAALEAAAGGGDATT